jgi:hypothetical protein
MSAICVFMCSLSLSLSLSAVLFVAADRHYHSVDLHSHTHSFSLSVSPLPCLSFFPLKRCCATVVVIIEIQDSFVFGCSHFIKVALIRNLFAKCQKILKKTIYCLKLTRVVNNYPALLANNRLSVKSGALVLFNPRKYYARL